MVTKVSSWFLKNQIHCLEQRALLERKDAATSRWCLQGAVQLGGWTSSSNALKEIKYRNSEGS